MAGATDTGRASWGRQWQARRIINIQTTGRGQLARGDSESRDGRRWPQLAGPIGCLDRRRAKPNKLFH